jgi:putative thioredoxin
MTDHAMDITSATFEREVLEASRQAPVVVDFWAAWCGPCKALGPVLEKLAAEYGGRFRLAKVDTESNPELASAFGVRSIPDVRAFRDGKMVGQFMGALPEGQVRAFIDKLLPTPSDIERARAAGLRKSGDGAAAASALRRALELDADNQLARLDLAEMLIELKQLDDAERLLDAVRSHIDWDARVDALRAALQFARTAQSGPGERELKERLAASPDDVGARMQLANRLAGAHRYREAMDELLEVIRRDKDYQDGEARKQMLAIFGLIDGEPEVVSEYRRKLSRAIY